MCIALLVLGFSWGCGGTAARIRDDTCFVLDHESQPEQVFRSACIAQGDAGSSVLCRLAVFSQNAPIIYCDLELLGHEPTNCRSMPRGVFRHGLGNGVLLYHTVGFDTPVQAFRWLDGFSNAPLFEHWPASPGNNRVFFYPGSSFIARRSDTDEYACYLGETLRCLSTRLAGSSTYLRVEGGEVVGGVDVMSSSRYHELWASADLARCIMGDENGWSVGECSADPRQPMTPEVVFGNMIPRDDGVFVWNRQGSILRIPFAEEGVVVRQEIAYLGGVEGVAIAGDYVLVSSEHHSVWLDSQTLLPIAARETD